MGNRPAEDVRPFSETRKMSELGAKSAPPKRYERPPMLAAAES